MVRVVFDTVVFVRSLINPYSRWGELIFKHSDNYRLIVSKPLLVEILEVLARPEITKKFKSIPKLDKNRLLGIISQAEVVEISDIGQVSRDIKDNKVLATAKAAAANYLVTEDKDLLVLKDYKGAKIIDSALFLKILSGN